MPIFLFKCGDCGKEWTGFYGEFSKDGTPTPLVDSQDEVHGYLTEDLDEDEDKRFHYHCIECWSRGG